MNIREATKSVQSVDQMPKPLTGNESIARGAWEAGVRVAAAYPGTPSTEILENLGKYPTEDIAAQWATNEKVSLDVVCGAALSGVRSIASMKHVGLNVAADTLMSQTYIGVHAGLVIVVCDDPGIHSSQNEQDTRILARFANVPVLEPSDAQEAHDFTKLAFDISEEFDTPVIVRSTTRLSHTRSSVFVGKREEHEPKGFVGNSQKTVAIPANARRAHPKLFEREARLKSYFDNSPLTQWEKGETRYGIITHGTPYLYVKEVAGAASTLKLAASYPLAEETVRAFAASVDRLLVVEELEPVIEEQIKAMGIPCEGKAFFPRAGELSPEIVREGLAAAGLMEAPAAKRSFDIQPVVRPPVLCAGCPHTSSYMALRAVDGQVAGDIG
ncbi:MAG: indolepyruvate ferredoxin oxidoreductase subunit alpha, partial [Hyphomicrobiales bacterium]|nr:indolepyruvate ferredoxin oxidoreductase subunit alpha [Hyphomicrobiales bacterium]